MSPSALRMYACMHACMYICSKPAVANCAQVCVSDCSFHTKIHHAHTYTLNSPPFLWNSAQCTQTHIRMCTKTTYRYLVDAFVPAGTKHEQLALDVVGGDRSVCMLAITNGPFLETAPWKRPI